MPASPVVDIVKAPLSVTMTSEPEADTAEVLGLVVEYSPLMVLLPGTAKNVVSLACAVPTTPVKINVAIALPARTQDLTLLSPFENSEATMYIFLAQFQTMLYERFIHFLVNQ
ncbi:hypothetical protein A3465_02315 [Enterobacter roggenkampii]|nr:hypothetical protein A3465_02315 [Enterobacter roggenkampii]